MKPGIVKYFENASDTSPQSFLATSTASGSRVNGYLITEGADGPEFGPLQSAVRSTPGTGDSAGLPYVQAF